MKIDGFEPADSRVALEEGTTFTYKTKYGDVTVIAKIAGDENEAFSQAMAKLFQRQDRERRLGNADAKKSLEDTIRVYAENVVINWSTTAKSEGKPIASTVNNFVELMSSQAFRGAFTLFVEDCSDLSNFRREQEEDIAKN